VPAINGLPGETLEVGLLFAAMDSDKDETDDILNIWRQMSDEQQRAFRQTLKNLEDALELE
jgi:hypothetical protein